MNSTKETTTTGSVVTNYDGAEGFKGYRLMVEEPEKDSVFFVRYSAHTDVARVAALWSAKGNPVTVHYDFNA